MADKYILRLPEGMRDLIRQRAQANRRSMNSEIVHCLDRVLAADSGVGLTATGVALGLPPSQPQMSGNNHAGHRQNGRVKGRSG